MTSIRNMQRRRTAFNLLRRRPGLESVPARIARPGYALDAEGELARVAGIEQRTLVRDDAPRVPLHERLVETLHAVLRRPLLDEVGDVQRGVEVADLLADRGGVDQHLGRRDSARPVAARHEAERNDPRERGGQREPNLRL